MPSIFAAVCIFLLSTGCSQSSIDPEHARVLRLAHGLSIDHPVHEAMVAMAEQVAESSAGKMRIEIYPSGQLGSERECLELLQIGSIAITKVSASVMESFAPEFRVFSLPFLFQGQDHRFAVLDGPIGRSILNSAEPYRLHGLAYYDAGARSFYTVGRPVREPGDLRGLKIRVQESKTAMDMVRTLGGSPTPISWGELYTALQQGVVDGAENNPPSFYLSRHYEVAKFYVLNEHTAVPDVLVVGMPVWNRLTPQEQQWLQEAATNSVALQRELWSEATAEALAEVEAAGVEVIRPDKSAFSEAVKDMIAQAGQDPVLGPLINAIHADGAAADSASRQTPERP